MVLYFFAAVWASSNLVYVIWGSAETQWWNWPEKYKGTCDDLGRAIYSLPATTNARVFFFQTKVITSKNNQKRNSIKNLLVNFIICHFIGFI